MLFGEHRGGGKILAAGELATILLLQKTLLVVPEVALQELHYASADCGTIAPVVYDSCVFGM